MPEIEVFDSVAFSVTLSSPQRHPRLHRLSRQFRLFPRRFWLLVAGTLLYLVAISLAFPYTPILLERRLHLSLAASASSWVGRRSPACRCNRSPAA